MLHTDPPPFFHRGPSPLARLAFFALLSIALLFADTRFRYLEGIRHGVSTVIAPLQRAVLWPGAAWQAIGVYFASKEALATGRTLSEVVLAKKLMDADTLDRVLEPLGLPPPGGPEPALPGDDDVHA